MDIKEDYHSETNLDISQIEEIERRLQENLLASYEHQVIYLWYLSLII